ncbi:toll/interleukin-1 receptor domain-containing protein [Streptomyces poonensis]|uniref:TIR domain-containing protein n=1 Tax=Streptomyces poonensis TaxID=68255 RepID=A0A918PHR5_9ACTN|nr:toll/interleukin-1 receptor domain-containing protein [Streptomyces poonensis]GGZ10465.1 hypothetical protein GCM10010365_32140 [Streptomyces poonensis]GLJ91377.1 hypothetical protein GCM10017589_39840 [Streptomyces poonensis]
MGSVKPKAHGEPLQGLQVFISYAHVDRDAVLRMAGFLNRLGLETWLDSKDIAAGDYIVEEVARGIEQVDLYVVFLSRASLASSWVRHELNTALTLELRGKKPKVIPVLLEKVDLPGSLVSRLYVDASRSLEDGFESLRRLVVGHGEEPSPGPAAERQMWISSARFSLYADTVKTYGGLSADHTQDEVREEAVRLLTELRKKANGILLNFIPVSAIDFSNPAFSFPNGEITERIDDLGGELVGTIGNRAVLDVDIVNPDPSLLTKLASAALKDLGVLSVGYQFSITPPVNELPRMVLEKLRDDYSILSWDPDSGAEVALPDDMRIIVSASPGSIGIRLETKYPFQLEQRANRFSINQFMEWLLP